MSETTLQREAKALTERLLANAGNRFPRAPGPVQVRFDLTGKTAGMVLFPHRGTPVIRYNAVLLEENGDHFLNRTVPHEVAHIVARRQFGKRIRPHGKEWREVMRLFNAESSRCHNYDTTRSSRRQMKRFTYRCTCQTHQLSSVRHNRVLRGQTYLCVSCKQPLVAA